MPSTQPYLYLYAQYSTVSSFGIWSYADKAQKGSPQAIAMKIQVKNFTLKCKFSLSGPALMALVSSSCYIDTSCILAPLPRYSREQAVDPSQVRTAWTIC